MELITLNNEAFTNDEISAFETKYLATMQNLANLVKSKKSLEEQEKALKTQLEAVMSEYSIKSLDCEYLKIGRVAESESHSIDLEALKEKEPKLYEELHQDYPKITKKKAYITFKVK